jgi:hypothetical protein
LILEAALATVATAERVSRGVVSFIGGEFWKVTEPESVRVLYTIYNSAVEPTCPWLGHMGAVMKQLGLLLA